MSKITKIETHLIKFKLSTPSAVAYATLDEAENIVLRIDTSDGFIGWGIAAPDIEVTGEKIIDVKKFLDDNVSEILKNADSYSIGLIDTKIRDEGGNIYPSARAAVNIALFDLLGKKCKHPLFYILSPVREKIVISYTIGLIPLEDALKQTKEALKKSFKILKIKIGKSVVEDIERIRKIHEIAGKQIILRLDANQGYNINDSLMLIESLRHLPIEFLEQPTIKTDFPSLKEIDKKSAIPIMADESAVSLNDIQKICLADVANLINIKLMKSGGISDSVKMNFFAESFGKRTMIGCMDESVISISAGLHFALSQQNTIYADLDGHFDIINDIAEGGVRFDDGYLYPMQTDGLGVNVKL